MRALVAAEADAFPDVAADYLARSWDRNMARLADTLVVLSDRGLLQIDDAGLAAEQLVWLAIAAPQNRMSLQGAGHAPDQDRLTRIGTEAVTTFLSRYQPSG